MVQEKQVETQAAQRERLKRAVSDFVFGGTLDVALDYVIDLQATFSDAEDLDLTFKEFLEFCIAKQERLRKGGRA